MRLALADYIHAKVNPNASHFDNEITNTPERRLLVAMFCRAYLDLWSPEQKYKRDAFLWFTDNRTHLDAFSCDWVCEELGICAEKIKRKIWRIMRKIDPAIRAHYSFKRQKYVVHRLQLGRA